ncbi:hypothetical protein [Tolypothrix sp. VBCCA 56010]|uniref:hypothetical protein n=1 Tax=Tolypothrix sp. VBCCA 56010 TaxID=3137731 RepID=UPI003D7CA5FB
MADKTLATFRIDPQEWETFKNAASAEGTNASAVFTEFVRWYNSGNRLGNSTAFADTNLDKTIDKRLDIIEQRLDTVTTNHLDTEFNERLEICIDKVLDDRGLKPEIIKEQLEEQYVELATGLNATLSELSKQLEELRGKLKAR